MNKFIVVFVVAFILITFKANAQKSYFDQYRPVADSLSIVYQIPASVILAVAYHESGGGSSLISRRLNNHFGLKGRVAGGDTISIKSSYRYFPTAADSYIFFCDLIAKRKFYSTLKGNEDYKKWVVSISNAGYAASAKRWSTQIINLIEKYKL